MTTYQIITIIGIPSIFSALITFIITFSGKTIKKLKQDNEAVKLGLQALLRSEMIKDWNKYSELGYAPIFARENFENCWKQYHSLGANGVMDNIHNEFMKLPIK